MRIFITGTGTNIGKTLISSWLCLHTGYDYFKPIQTGYIEGMDSSRILDLSGSKIYKEIYNYKNPVSPHLAAHMENEEIDMNKIILPDSVNLIVEGAGGVLVPINKNDMIVDMIKYLSLPVILIASSQVGTINHTLLSLEALKMRGIEILGVIISGEYNLGVADSIEFYGKTKVLAQFPFLPEISKNSLSQVPLAESIQKLLGV